MKGNSEADHSSDRKYNPGYAENLANVRARAKGVRSKAGSEYEDKNKHCALHLNGTHAVSMSPYELDC